jgi:hypothetical protein
MGCKHGYKLQYKQQAVEKEKKEIAINPTAVFIERCIAGIAE